MFKLEMDTNNAAFSEGDFEAVVEVARILHVVADQLMGMQYEGPCIDANGNKVGRFTLTED